ncbi:DUF3667 domain-containing protein [Gramella sp. BOM4]|nr:DUF3667 domain-containing protein [Christiangramia bathymodioli]
MKYRGKTCLNCHLPLEISDQYCPNCGQLNTTKKLSFKDFFEEFFSGVFAYDSRFQRTLRVLLFKPGKISKDYINGKRMRYANPFRFYLSASILFFLLFGLTMNFDNPGNQRIKDLGDQPPIFAPGLPQSQRDSIKSLLQTQGMDSINKVLNQHRIDSIRNLPLAAVLDTSRVAKDTIPESYLEKYVPQKEIDTMHFWNGTSTKIELYSAFLEQTKIHNSEVAMDSLKHEQTAFNHWLYKKVVDFDTFQNEPNLFINYFVSKLPFIIFFYLPVFALFIWLLYIRRPFNYMEHLIFAFHTQTMFFVLYGLAILLQLIIGNSWPVTGANFIFLFYLYKGMRYFYGQGRVKTILKFILLNLIFFILAIIAAVISLLASFSIY